MDWILKVDKIVNKQIARIPALDARRINYIIRGFAENPYSGDIEKMHGQQNVWRRRVGNYRIFYELYPAEKAVNVYHIERRTSKTY